MFAPGFFPNATQLVCIPVMALVNGPPSMGDRGMSMTSQDRPFTAPEEAYIANGPKHLGKNMTKWYKMQMRFMKWNQYWKKTSKCKNVQMANEKSHWATPPGASCVLQMWKFLNDALFTLSEYVGYTWRSYTYTIRDGIIEKFTLINYAHLLVEMNGYLEKQFK